MEIRKATAEDFDIVFDFIEKLWTYNTYDREEIRKVYMDVIDDERSFAFLLWDEGVCRGMCWADNCFSNAASDVWLPSGSLYVPIVMSDEEINPVYFLLLYVRLTLYHDLLDVSVTESACPFMSMIALPL